MKQNPEFWLSIFSIVAMGVVQLFIWSHVTDDAYIGFRYVERLVNGEGWTFNPGERVEGFSNPLWLLILAAARMTTQFSIVDIARVAGFVASVVTVVLLVKIARATSPSRSVEASFYAALILLGTPGFHVYATAGLETPLLTMLVSAGVWCSLEASRARRVLAGVCFGLAAITRPEGPLYALLWWVWTGGIRNLRGGGPLEWVVLAVLSGPFIAYETFRLWYFGALLPNTFLAKPPGTFGGFLGLPALSQWMTALGGPLIAVFLLVGRPKYDADIKRLFKACVGPVVAATIFLLYSMSDWMPFGRFFVPVAPLLAACVGAVLAQWTREHATRPVAVVRIALVVSVALGFSSFAAWNAELKVYVKNEGNSSHVMRGVDQIRVGQWLDRHITPGSTVATKRLGGISFAAPRLIVWDLLGLTDREQARFINAGGEFRGGLSPVEARMPAVVAATDIPGYGYKTEDDTVRWLSSHYTLVTSIPQGNFGFIDVWVSKERMNDVLVDEPSR